MKQSLLFFARWNFELLTSAVMTATVELAFHVSRCVHS